MFVNTPAALSRKDSEGITRQTKKVIVFMTDGGITGQHYVRDQDITGEPPFNSKRKSRINTSNSLTSFSEVCDRARDDEIEVYTIAYTITQSRHINPLKQCATTEDQYVNATSGNLLQVFHNLATSISPLRLTN